jgi:RNA polymerase sigma-70 factor (ECF subfamily)
VTEATDERSLAERFCRERDEEAFRALYRLHTPALYRLARRLLCDASAAEDAVQETWLRAAQALPGFRWESRLSTWLGGIAINACREARRERPARAEVAPEPATRPPREERLDLQRALAGVAEGYREVLVLHDVLGHTHEEIGGLLGIEIGTSKSQLSRARRAVRERLSGRPEGDAHDEARR